MENPKSPIKPTIPTIDGAYFRLLFALLLLAVGCGTRQPIKSNIPAPMISKKPMGPAPETYQDPWDNDPNEWSQFTPVANYPALTFPLRSYPFSLPSTPPPPVVPPPSIRASAPKAAIELLTEVRFSAREGEHLVGGRMCPAGSNFAGSLADCGGGKCQGNQVLCGHYSKDLTSVVTDIMVTAEGAHVVGGPGCPMGYEPVGGAADCGGGLCRGNQVFCVRRVPIAQLQPGDTLVRSILLTEEGRHLGGTGGCPPPVIATFDPFRIYKQCETAVSASPPACPSGYEFRGSVADCGGGSCHGNQLLCVAKGQLTNLFH